MKKKLLKLSDEKIEEIGKSISYNKSLTTKTEKVEAIIQVCKDYRLRYNDLAARFNLPE